MKPDIHYLPRAHLQVLIDALHAAGFRCVGPRATDGAIVYDTLTDAAQLPWGVTQPQAPGHYRLHASDDARCFAWANGPQALQPLLFAPREALWSSRRAGDGAMQFDDVLPKTATLAVLGVRHCDLAALAIHDQHFLLKGTRA